MPRKKKTDDLISVLAQPEFEIESQTESTTDIHPNFESIPRDFLAASLESATTSIGQLFEKQAQLSGSEVADTVFDAFESAFISRLEQRLEPFLTVLIPEIKDTHTQLKQRATARIERRLSAFDRLKQIAATVTDECRLMLPAGEVSVVGEFVSWEPIQQREND
jgi:hypothetical protein